MPKGKAKGAQQASTAIPALQVHSRVTTQDIIEALEPSIKQCQRLVPILPTLLPMKQRKELRTLAADPEMVAKVWTPSDSGNHGTLTLHTSKGEIQVPAYKKVMPLITPYLWMRYGERPSEPFYWSFQKADILSAENQAYIDSLASSLVGQLRGHGIPHFCKVYDTYRGVADIYLYNLEDEFDDVRFTRWFWTAVESGAFGLRVVEKQTGRRLSMEEVKQSMKPDEDLLSDSESDSGDEREGNYQESELSSRTETGSSSSTFSEAIADIHLPSTLYPTELEECCELDTDSEGGSVEISGNIRRHSVSCSSTDSMSSSISFTDEYTIHAELYKMPVAVMFSEPMDGTMDELLEDLHYKELSPEAEHQWTAWIFQVCAALASVQSCLQLTHNDLHTNNILWKKTDQEYFYYKAAGRTWKVPTYGKLFVIIDYGRAIFTMNGQTCISSDYHDDHDAAGQYNFGSLEDRDLPRVLPNKSFDLCRLACSLLRGLYPQDPPAKPKGGLLTQDGQKCVYETHHTLFNSLWTWLRDIHGQSVLEDESGGEKYPGFDLYIYIAANVKGAVPQTQFTGPLFQSFLTTETIPSGAFVIPIYL